MVAFTYPLIFLIMQLGFQYPNVFRDLTLEIGTAPSTKLNIAKRLYFVCIVSSHVIGVVIHICAKIRTLVIN